MAAKLGYNLSPETLKLLQGVFAIKDTLTKKEARDLGLNSGATLTQVHLSWLPKPFLWIISFLFKFLHSDICELLTDIILFFVSVCYLN